MAEKQIFDDWPARYDQWFDTPIGRAVLKYESELILELLEPSCGELILDAGSGTGLFTRLFTARGASVIGLDISAAMLRRAFVTGALPAGSAVQADMMTLPFADGLFDKSVSITAVEFIADLKGALAELFRVTKKGGVVVVATLNSLSPWAERRRKAAQEDAGSLFNRVFFRSPQELLAAAPAPGLVRTAIHFLKDDPFEELERIERSGQGGDKGAFVAARWRKE